MIQVSGKAEGYAPYLTTIMGFPFYFFQIRVGLAEHSEGLSLGSFNGTSGIDHCCSSVYGDMKQLDGCGMR
jgi:hypothetical protein